MAKKKTTTKKAAKKTSRRIPGKRRERHRRFLELLRANTGKREPLTIEQMLLKSGYPKKSAREQSKVLTGIRNSPETQSTLQWMEMMFDKVKTALQNRDLNKEETSELRLMMGTLSDRIELLSGRPTSRTEHSLDDETAEHIESILNENK